MLGKERLKSVIYGFEVRATAIISNGLVHSVPKQKVLKQVKKELDRLTKYANLPRIETNRLWYESHSRYIRVSKQSFSLLRKAKMADLDYDDALVLRKNLVYEVVRKEFKSLEHTKNEIANEIEYSEKHDELQSLLSGEDIFFLCSSHINPAKDHADWEGKIYITENWEALIDQNDQELHGKIAAYIRNHKTRTVEWVTGEPVYLVTRPNCKHFLIPISVEEVLNNGTRTLLKRHNMYMEDEKEISYEYGQYKTYYERLKMLAYMKSMFDAEDLDEDIKNTRELVRKWGTRAKADQATAATTRIR